MTEEQFKKRTAAFAVAIIKFAELLPRRASSRVIANQITHSGTSVGANYRSACRARSRSEMISKLHIALEEADETLYWLEIVVASGAATEDAVSALKDEANQLASMLSRSITTLKAHTVKEAMAHDGYGSELEMIEIVALPDTPEIWHEKT